MPELKRVESRLLEIAGSQATNISELSTYLLKSGGKRVRPALVLLSASFRPHEEDKVIDVATAVELIHTASLVHDDIIDRADLRRGRPTLNSRWGNHLSVLTGDFLFARALALLTSGEEPDLVDIMAGAIAVMCEGQIEQILQAFNCNQTEEDYINQVRKKTAHLIAASCYAGALTSGASTEEATPLWNYGLHLGYAFQIIDDLLDFTSNPNELGKPVFLDLTQGIITLPVLYVLRTQEYGLTLRDMINKRTFTLQDLQYIQSALRKSRALEYTYARAIKEIALARANLHRMPDSHAKEALDQVLDYVLFRRDTKIPVNPPGFLSTLDHTSPGS